MRIPKRKAETDRLALQSHGPLYITQQGLDKLHRTIASLEKSMPQLKAELQETQAMGDLSENAAYSIAKGRLRSAQNRILTIGEQLKRVVVIHEGPSDTVQLGSEVTLSYSDGATKTWRIVGEHESNPLKGWISHVSPLGAELLGKRIGDSIAVHDRTAAIDRIE